MKVIETEVSIAAPTERVWNVLTDLAAYPAWNPSVRRATGKLEPGARLRLEVCAPIFGRCHIFVTLVRVVPGRELTWHGSLLIPGLFEAEHSFALESAGKENVRLVQSESFHGLLVPFMPAWVERKFGKLYRDTNLALKARSEGAMVPSAERTTLEEGVRSQTSVVS